MQAKSLKTEQKFNGQKINVKSTLTGSASFKSTTVFTLFFSFKIWYEDPMYSVILELNMFIV